MKELIAELERAEEGSRKLDALVFCAALHPDKKPERNFFYTNREEWGVFVTNQPRPGITFHDAPHYTTNLQDALGLALQFDSVTAHTLFSAALSRAWADYTEDWARHLARLLTIGVLRKRAGSDE